MGDDDQMLHRSTGVEDVMMVVVDDDSKELLGVEAAEDPTNYQESEKQLLEFSEDEETLIIRMYNLLGERWSLIAGRIPGRSAEEIEKYWNSRHSN